LSIHAELSLVVESRGSHHHTGREHDQRLETPAIERKISANVRSVTVLTVLDSVFTGGRRLPR
jgi:hypothetical protein